MDYHLKNVQRFAAERFPFDRDHYPELPADKNGISAFAQKHLHLHMCKNLGEIAAIIEPRDHGNNVTPLPPQIIRKLLVNAIRLADVSGVSIQDIQTSLYKWAKGLEK